MGPAQVKNDTPSNIAVTAREPSGQVQPGTVTTSLIDPKANAILHEQVDAIKGEGNIQVPGLKSAGPTMRLQMTAKAANAEAKIEDVLPVTEPSHVSHLALDKTLY